jgi:hypothetical protein
MSRTAIVAVIAGVLVVLVVVGGFMALDRTTLHWYAGGDAASYTKLEVENLAESALARQPFPAGLDAVACPKASYHGGNRTWVVSCGYAISRSVPVGEIDVSRVVIVDDRTGKVTTP